MNNNEPKKEGEKINSETNRPESIMRRFSVETDGNSVRITINELSGVLELKALLTELITRLR